MHRAGARPGWSRGPGPDEHSDHAGQVDGRVADLRLLVAQMESLHPDLFPGLPRATWRRRVAALERSLPSLRAGDNAKELRVG